MMVGRLVNQSKEGVLQLLPRVQGTYLPTFGIVVIAVIRGRILFELETLYQMC